MTVGELLGRMSATEFAEWLAYDRTDPIGSWRNDYMAAVVATTIANFSGRAKRPLKPEAFLPQYGPKKAQSAMDMLGRLKLAARLGDEASRLRTERSVKVAAKKAKKT